MTSDIDPKISYCFVLADDDPHKTSPFQGFFAGWMTLRWAMLRLIHLPADAVEPALLHQPVLARRMGGTGGWRWFPLSLRALDDICVEETAPFWVVFSGTPVAANAVTNWAERQIIRPLHVTNFPWGGATTDDVLDASTIRQHIETTLEGVRERDASLDGGLIYEALAEWRDKPRIAATFPKRGHNCTLPNHMTLESVGMQFEDTIPLIENSTDKYVAAIRESANAVNHLRHDAGHVPGFRLTPPGPGLILTAPALYRHVYQSTQTLSSDDTTDSKIVNKLIRTFQRQKTFQLSWEKDEFERLLASREAMGILRTRQEELEVHALVVGMRAAATLAATIRLPPAVNRTAGVVRQFAAHARAADPAASHKFTRLFAAVQAALSEAVGADLLRLIAETDGGIKLVTDAPMEWLPIGPLPLGLKFDCSRITATPGNLMAGELIMPELLRLRTSAFSDVLLISAFGAKDPIRNMIPNALNCAEPMWRDKLKVRSVVVKNKAEFCDALNSYDGGILVFDGHGHHNQDTDVGNLVIGEDSVDVWSLRGCARVPPVVILSACDTQATDRSHATTANGFLAAGARAVLGTLLPLRASAAAVFVARLLFRLSDFLPAAIAVRGEAIKWDEVVTGMLRMQLLTDCLRPYLVEGRINYDSYEHIHSYGNMAINLRRPDWFNYVAGLTAEQLSVSLDQTHNDFQARIPMSDAICYVHMGNPETILVDDSSTMDNIKTDLAEIGTLGEI